MKTTAVNIRDEYDIKGCRCSNGRILPPPHPSCIGNPFHLTNVKDDKERANVIQLYSDHFHARINYDIKFKEYVLSLRGKRIACFCKPLPCHLDVVVEYIENYYKESTLS